jgi:hypothetical protein
MAIDIGTGQAAEMRCAVSGASSSGLSVDGVAGSGLKRIEHNLNQIR